jgi:hypothetical protein
MNIKQAKKALLILTILLGCNHLYADNSQKMYEKFGFDNARSDIKAICSLPDLERAFGDDRYIPFQIHSSDMAITQILFDEKTLKIDRKNKTVEAWTIWIQSPKGRQTYMDASAGFDDFGYLKRLDIYDYKNNRVISKSYIYVKCSSDVIAASHEKNSQPQNIGPGSLYESIMNELKKHAKLK